nr:hypothetical protein [Pseudoflavonifractor capillosus]
MRYIGTRERVELLPDDRPPTRKQEQLVRKLTNPAGPVCPERNTGIFVSGRGDGPTPAGGGGACGGNLRCTAPPAAA